MASLQDNSLFVSVFAVGRLPCASHLAAQVSMGTVRSVEDVQEVGGRWRFPGHPGGGISGRVRWGGGQGVEWELAAGQGLGGGGGMCEGWRAGGKRGNRAGWGTKGPNVLHLVVSGKGPQMCSHRLACCHKQLLVFCQSIYLTTSLSIPRSGLRPALHPNLLLAIMWASQANSMPALFWSVAFLLLDENQRHKERLLTDVEAAAKRITTASKGELHGKESDMQVPSVWARLVALQMCLLH